MRSQLISTATFHSLEEKKSKPLHCYFFLLLFHPSLNGQKREGNSSQVLLHTFNLSFSATTPALPNSLHFFLHCHPLLPFQCLLLSIYLSVSFCHLPTLSALSLSLSLFLSFPLSCCKVMEAGVCGSQRARLRDYTAHSHERFMMLGSVCACVSLTLRH